MKFKLLIGFFIFLLMVNVAFAATTGQDFWFDCEDDVVDQWNGRNGTAIGGLTFVADIPSFNISGNGGVKSCDFDGTDGLINISFSAQLNMSRGTISLWYEADTFVANNGLFWMGLTDGNHEMHLSQLATPTDYRFLAYENGAYQFTLNEANVSTNIWSHFCMTWDTNDARLYRNGILSESDTSVNLATSTNPSVQQFGKRHGFGFFNGRMDEIKVFTNISSAADCQRLYNIGNRSTLPPANIVITQNTYNVTSAHINATAWRTDLTNPPLTHDSSFTVTFDISEAGNCSIGRANLNHTAMIADDANTLCATTDVINQTCTLPLTKELTVEGVNTAFISCAKSVTLQNGTSTSGNLSINFVATSQIQANSFTVLNAYLNQTAMRTGDTVFIQNNTAVVLFNLTGPGNCSLGDSDINYSTMVAADGTTKCQGVNATNQTCFLSSNKNLVPGVQSLYASCTTMFGGQNGTSTSGPLLIKRDWNINGTAKSGGVAIVGAEVHIINEATKVRVNYTHANGTGFWWYKTRLDSNWSVHGRAITNASIEPDAEAYIETCESC